MCIINNVGVQSFYLNKLMLCRLRLLYAGLYAILARCTYWALPLFQGVVHRTLTTLLARCTYCEIEYSLFYLSFYISKKANKQTNKELVNNFYSISR